jgi:NAD-dependent SIR2 family protein deacetylase
MTLLRDAVSRRLGVPDVAPPEADDAALRDFLAGSRRVFVLTGAGCSTESGIPDYRGPEGEWKRKQPIELQPFLRDPLTRSRYWARSLVGWRSFGGATPNQAHHALATLERAGTIGLLVTQNVDGLHQAAGSRRVVDLHGRLDRVACLSCRHTSQRQSWQRLLHDLNDSWAGLDAPVAPDGDADLEGVDFSAFVVPDCLRCGGLVKPDVVFFGENVPRPRVDACYALVQRAGSLLVLGSSLTVMSGLRFVRHAARQGIPVAIVNQGATRGDELALLRLDAPLGMTLTHLVDRVTGAVA